MGNIIVGVILVVLIALAIYSYVKNIKKGGCGCGCSGCNKKCSYKDNN